MKFIEYSFFIYLLSFFLTIIFFFFDRRKKRILKTKPNISILIPCYNDGESIELTIKSIYDSYPQDKFQLIVINDKSTDNSLEKLKILQKKYNFMLHDNPQNLGKSETLNNAVSLAEHEILVFIDADIILKPKNIEDMLARMQSNKKIAAVSCPYVPYNTGFLAMMQDIEYVMLNLVQWSYNTFGAITLRGGCFIVKKRAFLEVGKFSTRMMTEDIDLAYKLTKAGYKVEQSFHRVATVVPNKLKARYKQKLRRNAWGTHCSLKYPIIWIRNPLYLIMIVSFNALILALLFRAVQSYDLFAIIFSQPNIWKAFRVVFNPQWWADLVFEKSSFSLLSLPYVLPLLQPRKNIRKIVLIIPYSFIYVPMYSFAGISGWCSGVWNYRRLEKIGKAGGGIARK